MYSEKVNQLVKRRVTEILDSIRHGVVVVDGKGMLLYANKAAAGILQKMGIPLADKRNIAELGLNREMERAVQEAAAGASFHKQQCQVNCNGVSMHLSWDAVPIVAGGRKAGAILLVEDETEAVAMARQLKEWERLAAAGEAVAGLAHEIRNPMAAAQGILQLLDLTDDNEQRKKLMARFSRELDRMNDILTNYINLIQPPAEEEVELIDVLEVTKSVVALIEGEAALYNIGVSIRPVQPVPRVLGDPGLLKQAFLNIVKNAIEAMTEGGALRISMGCAGAQAWVEFKDNGSGIPPEHQDNVFRPFFTTKVAGTGLGLALSRRIVRGMGGEIKIFSSQLGTVVTVYLPAICQDVWR